MSLKEVPISINLELNDEYLDSDYTNRFVEKKFLELSEKKFLKCSKCENRSSYNPGICFCNNCKARLNNKKVLTTKSISRINYNKIINFILGKISTQNSNHSQILEENVIVVNYKDKQIYFIIPEVSDSEFLVAKDSDHCIVVYLDPRTKYGTNLFKNRSFYLGTFMDLDPTKVIALLDAISENPINLVSKNESTLNVFLEKIHGLTSQEKGAKFEVFTKNLLDALKNILPNKLEQIRVQHPDDLYNSKIVNIGGSGNEDFHIMNLYDYLSCIKPDRSGQAKCYNGSEFTVNDLGEALRHAKESDILMVSTTNKIAPTVWRDIIEMRRQKGYYKYVLIDKTLLHLLFSFLNDDEALSLCN